MRVAFKLVGRGGRLAATAVGLAVFFASMDAVSQKCLGCFVQSTKRICQRDAIMSTDLREINFYLASRALQTNQKKILGILWIQMFTPEFFLILFGA